MSVRNERLWTDVHDVHLTSANVKVHRDSDLAVVGCVTTITDDGFIVRSHGGDPYPFGFYDDRLRIER